MHSLSAIKNACAAAMDDDEPDIGMFREVVDPASVMEMAAIIEALLEHVEKTGAEPALVARVRQVIASWNPPGPGA